jgi:23S rRNA (cytosine1962-C5)-methyltransferase
VSVHEAESLAGLPAPSARNMAVHVAPAGERALRQGHPWLFERAIRSQSYEGKPGDLAVVFDARDRFLAVGLYDPRSPIRVKVLQHGAPATIDEAWFRARLAEAAALRAPLLETPTTGYRLVHGENDGLPGLVVDRYDATLVVKLYTAAWVPHLARVLPALVDVQPCERLVLRLGRTLEAYPEDLYGLAEGRVLWGPEVEGPVGFLENGLRFEANVLLGQKTGFFFDQRENRARVERLAAGRRTLNVFAYTGGFSLYAARGGAPEVTSTDLSVPALEAAERHFALNRSDPRVAAARHETLPGDAFRLLESLGEEGRLFDLVVIDPPSFAQSQAQVPGALAAYARLTTLGLGVLAPGGILTISSCSSRVTAEAFFQRVLSAAEEVGHPLAEIERTGHPLDHPIRFPEGAYLKCLYATERG